MFSVKFTATPEFAILLKKMSEEQQVGIMELLTSFVSEVFYPTAHGYNTAVNPATHELEVIVQGVHSFNTQTTERFTQQLANKLISAGFRELFYVSTIGTRPDLLDRMMAPSDSVQSSRHSKLVKLLKLDDKEIPQRFQCGINFTIMDDPAYLSTNPKQQYEYASLQRWVEEKQTDPTTRQRISAVGMIKNDKLKAEISQFLVDRVFGKNVEKYHTPTKDACVGTDPSGDEKTETSSKQGAAVETKSSGSVEGLTAHSALFTSAPKETKDKPETKPETLLGIFSTCNLDKEALKLFFKALRKAAAAGEVNTISSLFNFISPELIINMQDVVFSKQTALHLAIEQERWNVVKLLLKHGAALDIPDVNKTTARQLINSSKNVEIQNLIKEPQNTVSATLVA